MENGYLGLETERESLTFGGFIADCARRHGDRVALVSGDRRITYRDLESEVRQFAKALLAAGVTKGSTVALMLGNRPEFVVAAFGAGSIGAIVVPVSTFASAEERDYILRHSDASILVTQPSLLNHRFVDELLESHPELADGPSGQLRSTVFPFLRRIVSRELSPPDPVDAGDTSSTAPTTCPTSTPRRGHGGGPPAGPRDRHLHVGHQRQPEGGAARQRHADHPELAVGRSARSHRRRHRPQPVPLLLVGWVRHDARGPLAAGATVVTSESFTPDVVLDLVEREQVTVLQAMPHTYSESVEHEDFAKRDLSSLSMAVGAEPLVAALPDRPWRAQANGYGLTETFTFCTWADPEEVRDRYAGEFRTVHGRPLPGIDLRIVDAETGEPLPQGELGEIAVKGATFMLGYHKAYAEEYLDRNGYFRTGDTAYLDDTGMLHWGGRVSNMIRTGGRQRLARGDRVQALPVGPAEGRRRRADPAPPPRRGGRAVRRAPSRRRGASRRRGRPPQDGAGVVQGPEAGPDRRRGRPDPHVERREAQDDRPQAARRPIDRSGRRGRGRPPPGGPSGAARQPARAGT